MGKDCLGKMQEYPKERGCGNVRVGPSGIPGAAEVRKGMADAGEGFGSTMLH
jgi:hypothetical protein